LSLLEIPQHFSKLLANMKILQSVLFVISRQLFFVGREIGSNSSWRKRKIAESLAKGFGKI